jgi:hypothetical protein
MVNVSQKSTNNVKDCPATTHENISHEDRKTYLITKNVNYNKQVLKIYHQNICRLQFKIYELVAFLYPELPDILCISEHHLKSMQMQLVSLEEI